MAHIGQKLALGARSILSSLFGADELGNVHPEAHRVPIRHAALADAQYSAVFQHLLEVRLRQPVDRHALSHPCIHPADGLLVLPPLGSDTNDVLERIARLYDIGTQGVIVFVALVTQHQPVLRVEQGKGVAQGVNRSAQQFLGPAHFSLGLLAILNVLGRACHAKGIATGIPVNLGPHPEPAIAATGSAQQHRVVVGLAMVQRQRNRFGHAGLVVRVN